MYRDLPEPWFPSFLFPCPFFTWPSLDCHLSSKGQMSPCPLAPGPGIPITLASLSLGCFHWPKGQCHANHTSKIRASKQCGWLALTPWPSEPQQSFSFSLVCALIPGKSENPPLHLPVSHWEQSVDLSSLFRKIVDPCFRMSRRAQNNTNVLLIAHQQVRESSLDWLERESP